MDRLPRFSEEKILAQQLKTPAALEQFERLFIGQQIKKHRKRLKIKQAELAQKLGTSQSVIARIETGKQNLSIHMLVGIAHFLNKKISIRFY